MTCTNTAVVAPHFENHHHHDRRDHDFSSESTPSPHRQDTHAGLVVVEGIAEAVEVKQRRASRWQGVGSATSGKFDPRQRNGESQECAIYGGGSDACDHVELEPAEATARKHQVTLGSRCADKLRGRLNDTLRPQGVEVTAVMIRSVELPTEIAAQMSRRNVLMSAAAEQRALRLIDMQTARHEGEINALRQRNEIDRALESDETARLVEQVGWSVDRCVCEGVLYVGSASKPTSGK